MLYFEVLQRSVKLNYTLAEPRAKWECQLWRHCDYQLLGASFDICCFLRDGKYPSFGAWSWQSSNSIGHLISSIVFLLGWVERYEKSQNNSRKLTTQWSCKAWNDVTANWRHDTAVRCGPSSLATQVTNRNTRLSSDASDIYYCRYCPMIFETPGNCTIPSATREPITVPVCPLRVSRTNVGTALPTDGQVPKGISKYVYIARALTAGPCPLT